MKAAGRSSGERVLSRLRDSSTVISATRCPNLQKNALNLDIASPEEYRMHVYGTVKVDWNVCKEVVRLRSVRQRVVHLEYGDSA